jgi:bla regulator protein blaR1
MTFPDLSPLANHLWQSTLCAAAAWLLTLTLRKNRAAVRYSIWLAASAKFLIPFALLVSAGSQLGWRTAPALAQPQFSFVMDEIGRPFSPSAPAPLLAQAAQTNILLPSVLITVWLCGFLAFAFSRLRWWRFIRTTIRTAAPLDIDAPIRILSSRAHLEPGVFGVRKPVLLMPEGIENRLTRPQLKAIVAHELCHVRRRDNLTATIHIAVEAVFWFHPLVWWIEARLVEERERVCDEDVLRVVGDPEVYAQGILNVCRYYLESPLVCVSGITGADLKKRIDEIMTPRVARKLDWRKKLALIAAAAVALAGPVVIGLVNAPPSRAQSPAGAVATPAFEVASIKPTPPPPGGGVARGRFRQTPGGIDYYSISLYELIFRAYGIESYQLSGPDWLGVLKWNVVAHAPANATADQIPLMIQALLADRFKLQFHRITKELPVYALVVAKGGPKLVEAPPPAGPLGGSASPLGGVRLRGRVPLSLLAQALSANLRRPVIDMTGISGIFNISFDYLPDEWERPGNTASGAAEDGIPVAAMPGLSISEAMEKALGLKLEARIAPVEMLIVDRAEKVPTEN